MLSSAKVWIWSSRTELNIYHYAALNFSRLNMTTQTSRRERERAIYFFPDLFLTLTSASTLRKTWELNSVNTSLQNHFFRVFSSNRLSWVRISFNPADKGSNSSAPPFNALHTPAKNTILNHNNCMQMRSVPTNTSAFWTGFAREEDHEARQLSFIWEYERCFFLFRSFFLRLIFIV